MARPQSGKVETNLAWQPIEVVGAALQQIRNVTGDRAIECQYRAGSTAAQNRRDADGARAGTSLENAVKYSPHDTPIELNIRRTGELLEIIVCDRGGLPRTAPKRCSTSSSAAVPNRTYPAPASAWRS